MDIPGETDRERERENKERESEKVGDQLIRGGASYSKMKLNK